MTEFMPDAESGSKPIAFGDFSYYWIIGRKPISVRIISEKFATLDQIGYLAFEFLDGKLIRIVSISFCKMPSDSMVLIQGNHCCLGYWGVFTGLPVLGHREIPLTGYPGIALLHE